MTKQHKYEAITVSKGCEPCCEQFYLNEKIGVNEYTKRIRSMRNRLGLTEIKVLEFNYLGVA